MVTYHTMDKDAERNPDEQGEDQDGAHDVVCEELPCEQCREGCLIQPPRKRSESIIAGMSATGCRHTLLALQSSECLCT